jgi:signal transduction histidine kinase
LNRLAFLKKGTNLYLLILALFACSLLFSHIPYPVNQTASDWVLVIVLTSAIILLNHYIILVPPKGNDLSMDSSIYLACIFVFGIETALILLVLSTLVYVSYQRRTAIWKHLFNVSIYSLMLSGAYYVFIYSSGEVGLINLASAFSYFLTLVSYLVINISLIGLFFAIDSISRANEIVKVIIKESLLNYIITLALALILAILLGAYPIFGAIMFTFVIVLLSLAFRKYFQLYEEVLKDKTFREQILNSLPVGIMTVDNKSSDFSLNTSASNLLNMDSGEVKEMARNSGEGHPNKLFWDILSSKETSHNVKVPYLTEDHSHQLLISQSELIDHYNELIGRIYYFIDITDRDRLEKRIHQSEKLALLGELSARAAHEIRNPLTVISGFLTLMKKNLPEDDIKKYRIPLLLKEFDRINSIIEEMLLIAKPGAPILKEAYIEDIIEEILPLFNQFSEKKTTDFIINVDRTPLLLDTKQMTQVLYNLIRNSSEAIEQTGTISIYSKIQRESYQLIIQDNGSGIPAEKQETVFEPFSTSKESGTGLGLTIVQTIIENHQGEIELFQSNENGTTFIITLPIHREQNLY